MQHMPPNAKKAKTTLSTAQSTAKQSGPRNEPKAPTPPNTAKPISHLDKRPRFDVDHRRKQQRTTSRSRSPPQDDRTMSQLRHHERHDDGRGDPEVPPE